MKPAQLRWLLPWGLGAALCCAALAGAGCEGCPNAWGPARRPDVFILTLDATRADHLPGFGAEPALMPNLGAWMDEGLRFTSAYTSAPLTFPAHVSLLSGDYPWTHLVRTMVPKLLNPVVPNLKLVRAAQRQGYLTAAFVGTVGMSPDQSRLIGFDVFDMPVHGRRSAEADFAAASAWLESVDPKQPVLLWVHVFDAHWPYQPASFGFDRCPMEKRAEVVSTVASTQAQVVAQNRHEPYWPVCLDELYRAKLAEIDRMVPALRAELGARGDYFWAILADHGECLGDEPGLLARHSATVAECAVRIPLAIGGAGRVRPGVRDTVASIIDVAPTLAHLMGWPIEATDGIDLLSRSPDAAEHPVRFEAPGMAFPTEDVRWLGGRVGPEKVVLNPDTNELRAWRIAADRLDEIPAASLSPDGQRLADAVWTAPWPSHVPLCPWVPEYRRDSIAELRALGYIH